MTRAVARASHTRAFVTMAGVRVNADYDSDDEVDAIMCSINADAAGVICRHLEAVEAATTALERIVRAAAVASAGAFELLTEWTATYDAEDEERARARELRRKSKFFEAKLVGSDEEFRKSFRCVRGAHLRRATRAP